MDERLPETLLFADAYIEARELPTRRVVVLRRTANAGSVDEVLASFRQVSATIRPDHRAWGLVMDMRDATGRSDPDFERSTEAFRRRATEAFARVVALVRTQAGRLQTQRLARQESRDMPISFDYEEAITMASTPR